MKAPLFLRAKHWQIFVPAVVIPFVTMIVFMVVVVSTVVTSGGPEGLKDLMWINYFMPIVAILSVGTQLLWMWNVAVNLRRYILIEGRKTRLNLFKLTFFLPLVYISVMPFLFMDDFANFQPGHRPPSSFFITLILMGIIGNFSMMFCFLNNNYVVAKTIKMAELQRQVTFGDFVGDFFFLLIFPVAIWFLQPRINRIVNGETEEKKVWVVSPPEKDLLDF